MSQSPAYELLARWNGSAIRRYALWTLLFGFGFLYNECLFGDQEEQVELPEGVQAVWDVEKASRQITPTREQICINGLWRWQPARELRNQVPKDSWGWFKVPGCWPGITDYLQKDCQTVFAHPTWKNDRLQGLTSAWYQRSITIPDDWMDRRMSLSVEYLNSLATVYVDGNPAGELRFPGGELDLTALCRPGATHVLSLQVTAVPLKGVLQSFIDSNNARTVTGKVDRRGLCGDVYLIGTPVGPRINRLDIDTSVRKKEITLDAVVEGLSKDATYILHARIQQDGKPVHAFRSRPFVATDDLAKTITFKDSWMPDRLWDLHTPENVYQLSLSLEDAAGKVLDVAFHERFGFREFWIERRDFYLNGWRLFLSAVPLDNAQVGAGAASYSAVRESLLRLKSFGINFVYTHNYGCEPGTHLSFAEILRAADDVGMLVAVSQPHFSHYDWQAPDADGNNGYRAHAKWYVRAAGNHPSIVFYSMNHNATGYDEDMNPDKIDGLNEPRTASYELNNANRALRAETIVRNLDPTRIVYHHAGGNIGAMHTINFYPNFVPIQEMSDWFGHWATKGVKPVFTCEYGAPFSWDWAMYRGWFKGERSFGSAQVPWDFCLSEWNSQFVGDVAYRTSELEKANLRWEAAQYKAGRLWRRWEYPQSLNSTRFEEREPIIAAYIADNWRAFRGWGVSANSPWEHGQFWKLRDGVDRRRKELRTDWQNLQRPGFSPDYIDQQYERMDLAYERSDWIPTAAAKALIRNNLPLLGFIAGRVDAYTGKFTSKDHIFHPGETVLKQLIIVNNSRKAETCDCAWSVALPNPLVGSTREWLETGEQGRNPIRFTLPESLAPGTYELRCQFKFGDGQIQDDSFAIHVVPKPQPPRIREGASNVALYDPQGDVGKWLAGLGITFRFIDSNTELAATDLLIVGRSALTVDGPAPDISRVRDGLRVLIFEQTADVLEKRFGFRTAEYGLRQVYPRVPDHPLLAELNVDHLRDWRGESTTLPGQLKYESRPRHGPTVQWCGMPVSKLWRCGNRGNVASILIEKPARGDFLPIVDGGFSLQYSPLMEFREGQGMVLFCQMDVTGRTATDPAAETIARRCLEHLSNWKPAARRIVVYVGDDEGRQYLTSCGVEPQPYIGTMSLNQILVVGPGGIQNLIGDKQSIENWLTAGGHLLAIGQTDQELNAMLPYKITTKNAEHISAWFAPAAMDSPLAGVSPAEVHNRDPSILPLVVGGATIIGEGVLAQANDANVVFCQLVPWRLAGSSQQNHRKTFRRTSVLMMRVLAGMGASGDTPLLTRFHSPQNPSESKPRWTHGLYLDQPEEWDYPYRFFRW